MFSFWNDGRQGVLRYYVEHIHRAVSDIPPDYVLAEVCHRRFRKLDPLHLHLTAMALGQKL